MTGSQVPAFSQPTPSQNILSSSPLPPRISQQALNAQLLAATPVPLSFGRETQSRDMPVQPPQMRPVALYSSMFAPAAPGPVFGVPLGQPSSSNTGSRRPARRNNQGTTLVQRTRKLCLNVMIILLPCDVSPLLVLMIHQLNLSVD